MFSTLQLNLPHHEKYGNAAFNLAVPEGSSLVSVLLSMIFSQLGRAHSLKAVVQIGIGS